MKTLFLHATAFLLGACLLGCISIQAPGLTIWSSNKHEISDLVFVGPDGTELQIKGLINSTEIDQGILVDAVLRRLPK